MSKKHIENSDMNTQPPKRDNRVVILLSVILVVLFAIVIAIVAITVSMKNKEIRDSAQEVLGFGTPTQSTTSENDSNSGNSITLPVGQSDSLAEPGANSAESSRPSQSEQTEIPQTNPQPTVPATKEESTKPSKPADGVQALQYYNEAIDKAVNSKTGYRKTRISDNDKLEGSSALQAMKDLLYGFMGIGAENSYTETVENGKWGSVAFLVKSRLTAADVTSAICTESGANYVITLKLKNGASSANKSNPTTPANSALDKCGICVGAEDKGYFDHKTASVIYDAIAGTYAGAEVKENYTNATVVATVNSATGKLVSLTVEWNQAATLSKLAGMSATASCKVHVKYMDFKY